MTPRRLFILALAVLCALPGVAGATVIDYPASSAAPLDAKYITATTNATLTAEQSIGALTTGLLLNTVAASEGTLSAYGGTSCTNQFPRSLNASGAATCASVSLTLDVTGTLPYGNGGTGATSYTTNAILKAGASAFADSSLTDDGSTVTSTVTVLLPAGTSAAPGLMFGAVANGRAGIWEPANGVVGIGARGQTAFFYADFNYGLRLADTWGIILDNAAVGTAAPAAGSVTFTRAAAGTPYFYGSSTAVGATLRLGNTNVGYEDFARNSEAHTLAAAGTSTTATAVWPANSGSQAASFRITTEITGCTSVQVGVAGDVTRYGTFNTLTAGQTIAIGRIDNYAAETGVLFTCVGGGASFTAGVVRVNLRYITASASTS